VLVKPPIYGLQVEFRSGVLDTRTLFEDPAPDDEVVVLDPFDLVIVGAGVSTVEGDELYDGSEHRILSLLDRRFAALEPGIFTTWNGSILDLPLLRARARALQLELGLRIRPDRRRPLWAVTGAAPAGPRRSSYQVGLTPGGGTRPVWGAWHQQRHLDLRWAGEPGSDESVAATDPCRGAHQARALAERRWNRIGRHLDGVPSGRATGSSPPAPGPGVMVLAHRAADLAFGLDHSLEASRARHPSNGSR